MSHQGVSFAPHSARSTLKLFFAHVSFPVFVQFCLEQKLLLAGEALKPFLAPVNLLVMTQVGPLSERPLADVARERFVSPLVILQVYSLHERPLAKTAHERFFTHVSLFMSLQMDLLLECLLADAACERSLPCVCPLMSNHVRLCAAGVGAKAALTLATFLAWMCLLLPAFLLFLEVELAVAVLRIDG